MKYRLASYSDVDLLEITTEGSRVVDVVSLVPPADGSQPMTAEELQDDLEVYLHEGSENTTIEDALAAYVGGLNSLRKVGE